MPPPCASSMADDVVRTILKALVDEACKGPSPRRVTTRASDGALNEAEEGVEDGGEIAGGERTVANVVQGALAGA